MRPAVLVLPAAANGSNGSREPVAELTQRVTGGIGRYLGVDLHGDGDLAVPKDVQGRTRTQVERTQQRAAGLTCAVDGDPRDTSSDNAAVKAEAEVTRLDRGAVSRGEGQAGINPAVSCSIADGILLLLADLDHVQLPKHCRSVGHQAEPGRHGEL